MANFLVPEKMSLMALEVSRGIENVFALPGLQPWTLEMAIVRQERKSVHRTNILEGGPSCIG